MKIGRKGPLPEWNLSKYDEDPLQWSEWYGQFKSAVDSALLSDHENLTYLKTLVTGKAKLAIADVSYSGEFYQESLRTLERKFGQPQVVVGAYLDKLNSYPVLENIINFASVVSSMIGVFRSLRYDSDLNSASLLNQAVGKLPPNMRESWSLHTVKQDMYQPTLIHFAAWLKDKAEAHERMKSTTFPKSRVEDAVKSKTSSKVFAGASRSLHRPVVRQLLVSILVSYARENTRCGNALCLNRRCRPSGQRLLRTARCASRALMASIRLKTARRDLSVHTGV